MIYSEVKMTELKLILPDNLVQEATSAGLLTPESIEKMLREEIRRRGTAHFFANLDKLAALDLPALTPAEIEAEVFAARKAKRRASAGCC